MPLKAVEQLKPMLPPFVPDIEHAWMMLGAKTCAEQQLQAEMLRRAQEANELHDSVVALTEKQEKLLLELEDERKLHAATREQADAFATGAAEVNQQLRDELEASRTEAASYVDEISKLRARIDTLESAKRRKAA